MEAQTASSVLAEWEAGLWSVIGGPFGSGSEREA